MVIAVSGEAASNQSFLERALESGQMLIYFEALLSCYADELGMIQDMAFAINDLNESVSITLTSGATCIQSDLNSPKIDGNGHSVRVTIPVAVSAAFPATTTVTCGGELNSLSSGS